MSPLYGYCVALLIGASGAWYIQGIRWDNDVASISLASASATVAAVDAINAEMTKAREETESFRTAFIEYKSGAEREINDLERRVTAGPERLYIKAKCPAGVPSNGADAGRAGAGTAELDATATGYYFALERGLAEQYSLLQLCRSELGKRSAPPAIKKAP
jgi:hypothetical protein